MTTLPASYDEWVAGNPGSGILPALPTNPLPVMLDLETLGHKPGSVIVAIGAVKFGGGEIYDRFYRRVCPVSCERAGLRLDAATVLWWMRRSEEARAELCGRAEPLRRVLEDFAEWMEPGAELWGNGAGFDNVLLGDAYDALRMRRPWQHTQDRCYRTMKNTRREVKANREGVHHHALHDAETQARHLMLIQARRLG